jgi:hypothetical protein
MVVKIRQQPDEYELACGLIDEAVREYIGDWATVLNLAPTDARIDQFRDDVAGALRACIHAHIVGCSQDRENERSKRLRQKYLALQRRRIAALKRAERDFAPQWPPLHHEFQAFMSSSHPSNYKDGLKARADAMRLQADEWKLPPGRRPFQGFDALAEGVVLAYRRATGRTGLGFSAREGELRAFVEKVLPTAKKIARAVTGKPLKVPKNSEAIGEYLHRVASAK